MYIIYQPLNGNSMFFSYKLHNMQFSGRDGDERDGRDSAKSSKSSRFALSKLIRLRDITSLEGL